MEALLDPSLAETRVEFGMAEAEVAQRAQWRASASVFRAVDATLREAAAHPEVFIVSGSPEYAERAAVADLAVRLNLAEATVRAHAHVGQTLRARLPQLWAWFGDGEVSTQNAREAARLAAALPEGSWAAFDDAIVTPARRLAPARFKQRAQVVCERIHEVPLAERHQRAQSDRGVWVEPASDGMGWLHVFDSSDRLALAMARIDGIAFDLLTEPDESRTMAHLRADAAADLLIGELGTDVVVTVALTIPALSLLGAEGDSAVLEGAGPIDIETARTLCATAPSFTRVLTDPISSAMLDLDRRQYRPTAALKRWLAVRDVTCVFPGCGRAARACDLDHTVAWVDGGATRADNLAHLCRKHHVMKHESRWKVERPPGSAMVWTSPTGHVRSSDPPPF
jgi:hypothetical protein